MQLTRRQIQLAKSRLNGASVIKGDLGAGKTTIGTLRMRYIEEHLGKDSVLYVSPNELSSQKVRALYEEEKLMHNISLFELAEVPERIVMTDIAHLIEKHGEAVCEGKLQVIAQIPDEVMQKALKEMRKVFPKVKFLQNKYQSFLIEEIAYINAWGYTSLEMYQKARRKGCKIKLSKAGKSRVAIWLLKEKIEKCLEEKGQCEAGCYKRKCLEALSNSTACKGYTHIILDDTEQYTKVELDFIQRLKQQDEGSWLFLMPKALPKEGLNYFTKGQSFNDLGIDMTGKCFSITAKAKSPMKKQKKHKVLPSPSKGLTPLELFLEEIERKAAEMKKASESKVPWYVDTYKYVNCRTGVESVFKHDSSAGETYLDEEVQDEVDLISVPIYTSDIAAGAPIEVVDQVSDMFQIPASLLHGKKNTYMLHVHGDSMIGAHIEDGDYVVIEAGNAANHEIAAVYYNGATTLKRVVQEKNKVILVSENPKYSPIEIEDEDFRVMGKLVGIIKQL